jgi:hypothetical protein
MKWTVFDLEFTELLPPVGEPWGSTVHISCGSIYSLGDQWPQVWYERSFDYDVGDYMTERTVIAFVEALQQKVEQGHVLITWGGAATDWRMLYQECPRLRTKIKQLALHSIDIPLCAAMSMGMMMGLNSVCKALNISLKDSDSSSKVPYIWSFRERRQEVLQHVSNDSYSTAAVVVFAMSTKTLPWITQKGSVKVWENIQFMTVKYCLAKELPHVPWTIQPYHNPKILCRWLILDLGT